MRAEEAVRREAAYARQQAMLAKESRFVERFKTHVAAVTLGYYAQHVMDGLGGDRTVLEELEAHAPLANQGSLRKHAGMFGFSEDEVFTRVFFFSSRRRHTRSLCDWSSDVCSSD